VRKRERTPFATFLKRGVCGHVSSFLRIGKKRGEKKKKRQEKRPRGKACQTASWFSLSWVGGGEEGKEKKKGGKEGGERKRSEAGLAVDLDSPLSLFQGRGKKGKRGEKEGKWGGGGGCGGGKRRG